MFVSLFVLNLQRSVVWWAQGGRQSGEGMSHGHRKSSRRHQEQQHASPTHKQPKKCVIRAADMDQKMQTDAVKMAEEAMELTDVEMDIARHIKKGFDSRYPPPWHCIVGRKFGSYVTHESGYFIYFYLDNIAILLFKAQVT